MNIKLETDYPDFYDKAFEKRFNNKQKPDYVFRRMRGELESREQIYRFLQRHGVGTLPCGIPAQIHTTLSRLNDVISNEPEVNIDKTRVVVKPKRSLRLVYLKEALTRNIFDFAVHYPYTKIRLPSVAYKVISIGLDWFMVLREVCTTDWRSSRGTVEVIESHVSANDVMEAFHLRALPNYHPVYSMDLIDFSTTRVKSRNEFVYIPINYTPIPNLDKAKVCCALSQKDVVDKIHKWFNKFGKRYKESMEMRGQGLWQKLFTL